MSESSRGRLSFLSLAALSAPAFPMFALMMPLIVFIPPFYAEHMGMGMAAVGTVFLIGRTFDGLTDPVAGIIMDKTQRVISRKGWVVIGALPLVLATWQIFFARPPADTGAFMVWILVLYAGWTLMSVGLYSWAGEASKDYNERSRIMGAIQIANNTGTIGLLLVPTFFELFGVEGNIDVMRVRAMGAFVLAVMPLTLLFSWVFAPQGQATKASGDLIPALKFAIRNPSLLRLIAADFLVGFKFGVTTALSVFYVEIVSGLTGRASTLYLVLLCSSLAAIPVFVSLAQRFEKHRVLVLNSLAAAAAGLLVLVTPPGAFWIVTLAYILFGVASGTTQLLTRSIMADVVDEERVRTGNQNSGLYYAFLTTTLKLSLTLGVTVTFWLAGWMGFDPATARTDDSAHWVVRVLVGVSPILACGLIALCMWTFPLTRARQAALRRELPV